jgi:RNA polymerase sigma-70 factor, ECF subfamily
VHDWHLPPGVVDRHLAVIARNPSDLSGKPAYFIALQRVGGCVGAIRDFRHARYAIEAAEIIVVDQGYQTESRHPAPR